MKLTNLFAVVALMALSLGASAQKGTMSKGPVTSKKPPLSKTTPTRDAKTGRFVKKTMPARDPKTGRFVKAHAKTAKPGPARDPKTGRFIKKG